MKKFKQKQKQKKRILHSKHKMEEVSNHLEYTQLSKRGRHEAPSSTSKLINAEDVFNFSIDVHATSSEHGQ